MSSALLAPTPSKWWQVYEGDEECRFFKALSRHPTYDWRSIDSIAKEAKLTTKRVQEIVQKYLPTGIINSHQSDPDKYQYWERGTVKATKRSVSDENQKKRVDDALGQGNIASPIAKTP